MFHKGNTVKIKEDFGPENYSSYYIRPNKDGGMYKYAGKEVEIKEVIKNYIKDKPGYKLTGEDGIDVWTWSEDMFENKPIPKFKVGDKVIIKERKEPDDNYRGSFTETMAKKSGQICTIAEISCYTPCITEYKVPDDGYTYKLKEDDDMFNWTSGMFEKVSDIISDNEELDKINSEWEKSNTYKEDDPIVFKLHTEQLNYKVHRFGNLWWLHSPDHRNDILLEKIGLLSKEDQYDFVKQNSGCHIRCMPGYGAFPEIICDDETGINKVIQAIFKKIEETKHSVCPEGPLGKVTIPPDLKVIPSVDLVCDSASYYYDYDRTSETPKSMSLYDRIKTPEKAEYKLNFKN